MEKQDLKTGIVVIGGSAGSLQVILAMLKNLSNDLHFPILLVLHRKAQAASILPKLLQQFSKIDVIEIEDKTEIKENTIYIVPSDYHLLFENENTVSLAGSEKMNYSRPSIDVTFRSASEVFGESTVGVLLSGANADGVEGLKYIKKNGGKVWIQDPESADVDYMPKQAVKNVSYDLIFLPENLAENINELK